MQMHKPEKAPNIVPRSAIRLSEAFERLCRQVEPSWEDLQQRCVQWDEQPDNAVDERGEDPYPHFVAATYHAEMVFRTALNWREIPSSSLALLPDALEAGEQLLPRSPPLEAAGCGIVSAERLPVDHPGFAPPSIEAGESVWGALGL